MSQALALPGDIPGLLRRGSPALWQNGGKYEWRPCIVLRDPTEERAMCLDMDDEDPDDWHAFDCKLTQIALALTDATGRTHAAWWLADKNGLPAGNGTIFRARGPMGWTLHGSDGGSHFAAFTLNIDPNDPRLLPDGSRWVDAEALRRVVMHVAGRPL